MQKMKMSEKQKERAWKRARGERKRDKSGENMRTEAGDTEIKNGREEKRMEDKNMNIKNFYKWKISKTILQAKTNKTK